MILQTDAAHAARRLVLIGGGGHCQACIDVIEGTGRWEIVGILEKEGRGEDRILGYPIIGTDERIPDLAAAGNAFLITIGQIRNSEARRNAYSAVRDAHGSLATIVSPHAYISPHASVGEGSIVMHQAVINAGARVGDNVIVNTKALVEHGAFIADHCHVATAAIVNGDVRIGTGCFIGSGTVIVQGICVPDTTFVPAASLYRGERS